MCKEMCEKNWFSRTKSEFFSPNTQCWSPRPSSKVVVTWLSLWDFGGMWLVRNEDTIMEICFALSSLSIVRKWPKGPYLVCTERMRLWDIALRLKDAMMPHNGPWHKSLFTLSSTANQHIVVGNRHVLRTMNVINFQPLLWQKNIGLHLTLLWHARFEIFRNLQQKHKNDRCSLSDKKEQSTTVVSYQNESFSSKWELPSLLSPFLITRGRMDARRVALILMKISHFDRTPHWSCLQKAPFFKKITQKLWLPCPRPRLRHLTMPSPMCEERPKMTSSVMRLTKTSTPAAAEIGIEKAKGYAKQQLLTIWG